MTETLTNWGPYIALAITFAVTYGWRALGVALSGRIRTDSPIFEWVTCVAYALLAGLIARMIVLPLGSLAETPMIDRLSAALLALAVFLLTRKNLFLGVFSGFACLVLLTWGRAGFAFG
ncbi:AzlD domain-containing protein [Fodinicurvata fenggangensis]|uniref:AzlD domain-containing protein n=1 Tax=Fodinicurvata fenggangensis TaxID=1121830 RepID=UPI00047A50B4|nr:AzlD domain-containing protein [Fodinicurvata fenggangensis]